MEQTTMKKCSYCKTEHPISCFSKRDTGIWYKTCNKKRKRETLKGRTKCTWDKLLEILKDYKATREHGDGVLTLDYDMELLPVPFYDNRLNGSDYNEAIYPLANEIWEAGGYRFVSKGGQDFKTYYVVSFLCQNSKETNKNPATKSITNDTIDYGKHVRFECGGSLKFFVYPGKIRITMAHNHHHHVTRTWESIEIFRTVVKENLRCTDMNSILGEVRTKLEETGDFESQYNVGMVRNQWQKFRNESQLHVDPWIAAQMSIDQTPESELPKRKDTDASEEDISNNLSDSRDEI